MTDQPASLVPADYAALLSDIKQRVRHAQTRAMLGVNAELICLYWDIGAQINARQQQEGRGSEVAPRLARDFRNALPEEKSHGLWPFWNMCQRGPDRLENCPPAIEKNERDLESMA